MVRLADDVLQRIAVRVDDAGLGAVSIWTNVALTHRGLEGGRVGHVLSKNVFLYLGTAVCIFIGRPKDLMVL